MVINKLKYNCSWKEKYRELPRRGHNLRRELLETYRDLRWHNSRPVAVPNATLVFRLLYWHFFFLVFRQKNFYYYFHFF